MVHRHDRDRAAQALDQRWHEAMHVVEVRQAKPGLARHQLEAAAGIGDAVVEYAAAHGIGDARLEFLPARVAPPLAKARNAEMPVRLFHCQRPCHECRNVGRVVLAVTVDRDEKTSGDVARCGPQGSALPGTARVAEQPRWRARLLAMPQEHGAGVVDAAIVDQHHLVGMMAGEGAMNLVDQMPDVAGLVLRRNQHRDQECLLVVGVVGVVGVVQVLRQQGALSAFFAVDKALHMAPVG